MIIVTEVKQPEISQIIASLVSIANHLYFGETVPLKDYDALFWAKELLEKQQKLGAWIEEPDRRCHWHCSECGSVQGIVCAGMSYCPSCGTKMSGHIAS